MKRVSPALVLFILATAIAELLSGSAPPAEFFNPFGLIVLPALYGSGAVLVRELALRWGKRWPTILTLGLAFGIVEEGLMVKSFFDPNWPDLGALGSYGRWAGVNWIWAVSLALYHATVSIAIPILLVEVMFPGRRDARWAGRGRMIGLSLLLAADVLFGFTLLTPYRPPLIPYLLAVATTVGLYRIARRMPPIWGEPRGRVWKPLLIGLLGLGATFGFFFLTWGLSGLGVPAALALLVIPSLSWIALKTVRRASGEGAWTDRERLALVSGSLTFFILLAPLSEHDPSRADNPAGMTLVALGALVFLLWLNIRVRRRPRPKAVAELPAG